MKVLYLGTDSGTSLHRVAAMRRMGCVVDLINPDEAFGKSRYVTAWIWRTGGLGLEAIVRRHVLSRLRHERYDICIVNHPEVIGRSLIEALRPNVGALLHFNCDNPFVTRDRRRWAMFLPTAPLYDLHSTPRISTAEEGERRGLAMYRHVQTADEVVHRPRPETELDRARFSSDVAFVGTWMPERGPFVVRLLEAGIRVRIFGANWHKAPEYARLRESVVIPRELGDDDYVRAIQYGRIVLGFVSLANHDLHTKRSHEVPAIGSLLCARRTSQHSELYREDEEAVFWDTMDECAEKCRALFANPERIAAIAAAGARRQAASDNWNEILMRKLIDATLDRAGRGQAMGYAA